MHPPRSPARAHGRGAWLTWALAGALAGREGGVDYAEPSAEEQSLKAAKNARVGMTEVDDFGIDFLRVRREDRAARW